MTQSIPTQPLQTIAMPAQSSAVQPERFQSELISGMTRALLRQPSPPCLLRAPTGSGKTFFISQVLERVSAQRDVLWFWFVSFVTLVQQTEDALRANAPNLAPYGLNAGRNQDAHPGMVLLSTAHWLASSQGFDRHGCRPTVKDLEHPKTCAYFAAVKFYNCKFTIMGSI